MKIVICASIDFTPRIKEAAESLRNAGHSVEIPVTSKRIIDGELTLEEYLREKGSKGDGNIRETAARKIKDDVIRHYYRLIKESDAILVLNLEKKGIRGYIGGNTLIEMAFAHVLGKKIFLYDQIPEMAYTDEIEAMQPTAIDGDFEKVM